MNHYKTPESALADLQKRGFVYDFSLNGSCIECEEAFTTLQPGEFNVAEIHKFDSAGSPKNCTIVYAIDSSKGIKGIVLEPLNSRQAEFLEQNLLVHSN